MHQLQSLTIAACMLPEQKWLYFICNLIPVFKSREKDVIVKFESHNDYKYPEKLKIERKNRVFSDKADHEIKISLKLPYGVPYNFSRIFEKVHALVRNKMRSHSLAC